MDSLGVRLEILWQENERWVYLQKKKQKNIKINI